MFDVFTMRIARHFNFFEGLLESGISARRLAFLVEDTPSVFWYVSTTSRFPEVVSASVT